jgi:alginate O-acetyltransferase complex protein AlgI
VLFSSIIFLGLFLPATFFAYHLAPRALRNPVLALASIVFYAWGEPRFVILMLASVGVNFALARRIDASPHRRLLLALAVAINLLLLGIFKYGNFAVANLDLLLAATGHARIVARPIDLPLGISFYTFHAISYLIDIYRRNARPSRSLVEYSLYIMLFPQLIAGPIIRYKDIHTQLAQRAVSAEGISAGITRFTIGLAKKILVANQLAGVADAGFNVPATQLGAAAAWLCLLCYTLQIYFDFSGYSDMAIGLGSMFGFRFPENFRYPYAATSMQDFWRRWHISLSTWFRDYVYIPLGGNRGGTARTLANLWAVFLLTGLWHGASWNFVIWGIVHGFFLMLERLLRGVAGARGSVARAAAHAYTLGVVMLAWVFFRAATLGQARDYLLALLGRWPGGQVALGTLCSGVTLTVLAVALVLAGGIYPRLLRAARPGWDWLAQRALDGWARAALTMPALLVSCMSIALGQYNPFIYFRF